MTGPIFDTHAHYSARAFDADRDFLLGSLPGKGVVGVCEQATHSGDAPRVLELAHRYPWVVAAVGIHPESLLPAADCGEEGPAPTVSVYGGDWAAEMRALRPAIEALAADTNKTDVQEVEQQLLARAFREAAFRYALAAPLPNALASSDLLFGLLFEQEKLLAVQDTPMRLTEYAQFREYPQNADYFCLGNSVSRVRGSLDG